MLNISDASGFSRIRKQNLQAALVSQQNQQYVHVDVGFLGFKILKIVTKTSLNTSLSQKLPMK